MKRALKNRKIVAAAALTCAALLSKQSHADQPLILDQQNGSNFISNTGAWGFTIQVGSEDLIVNQIGFVDEGNDGLAASHAVGFYLLGDDGNFQTNMPVATDTVNATGATSTPSDNGFRYNAVSAPITLMAGQSYSIVAQTTGGVDRIRDVRFSSSYADFNLGAGIVASPLSRFARAGGTVATDSPTLHRGINASFITTNTKVTSVVTKSWTGGSGNNLNSATNWGGTLPSFTTEDSGIAFNSATPSTVNNDVTGADLRTLRYDAGAPAINLTGNAFTITGSIANNSSNTQTISTGQITTNQSYLNANGGNVIVNSNISIPRSFVLVGAKDVTLNGNLTGAGSLEYTGTGSLTLNGDNSAFTGSIILNSNTGTLGNVNTSSGKPAMIIAPNAKALGSSSATVVPAVALTTGTATNQAASSAVLQINGNDNYTQKMSLAGKGTWQPGQTTQYPQVQSVGNNTWSGPITFTGNSVNHVLESASGNFTISTPLQATNNSLHNLYFQGAGDFTLSGGISEVSGTVAITKIGSGTAKITNTSSWTSLTRVQGGTLELDYTSAATQRLGTATLQVDGGTLKFTGNATASRLENVATLQLNGFSVTAGIGDSSIILNNGASGGTVGLSVGTITRGIGSTLDVSGNGSLTLPASLGAPAFIPYITTGGGASYAAVDASNRVVPYASYSTNTYGTGLNTDVTVNGSMSDGSITNSLRFNTAAADTVTLSGTSTLTSGAILVTPSVGAHNSTLDGSGTLVSGTGNELIVQQYNTAAPLIVNAQLFNGNTGTLTKSGPGEMIINSSNSFTGGTSINSGSILVTNANGLQNSNIAVWKNNGLVFQPGITDASIGMISGTGNLNIGAMNLTLNSTANVGGIYSGNLTGSGNLIHTSASTNTRLTGDNSGFTGNIIINKGVLAAQSPTALGSTSGTTTVTATSVAGSSNSLGGSLIIRTDVDLNENITIAGKGNDGFNGALRIDNGSHVTFRQPIVVDADNTQAVNPTNQTLITIGDDATANFVSGISASAAHPNPNLFLFSGGYPGSAAGAHTNVSATGSQTGENAIGTVSGNISIGTGTLLVDGAWIVTGTSNVWNGLTVSDFSNLQIGDGGANGSLGSGSIQLNQNESGLYANAQQSDFTINTGNLIFDRSGTMTVPNDISGSQEGSAFGNFGAGVQLYGTGTIIFTGNNSFNGGLTIANGTAQAGADNNLGASNGTISFISGTGTLLATGALGSTSRNIVVGLGATGTVNTGGFDSVFGNIFNPAGTLANNKNQPGNFHKAGLGNLTVNNANVAALAVDGGRLTIAQNGSTAATATSLSIANSASADLNDNRLTVSYTGTSPLATLTSYLKTGFNGGVWNGTSVTSGAMLSSVAASVAANTGNINKTALGAFDNGTTVLVRYTYSGDANDSGSVDSNDFDLLSANFGGTGKFWQNGDFNYDGIVNALDFNALATNYGAPSLSAIPEDGAVALGSIVPEPTTAGLMLSLAMGLVARRRRNH